MAYMTDEAMDEFAQWQHDSAWAVAEADDDDVIDVVLDCIHDNGKIHEYSDKAGVFFKVFECSDCNNVMEVK